MEVPPGVGISVGAGDEGGVGKVEFGEDESGKGVFGIAVVPEPLPFWI